MAKLFSIRKPSLRITKKGVAFTAPSARIGGKAGINLSKSGISGSVRGKHGSYNTRSGLRLNCLPTLLLIGGTSVAVVSTSLWIM